MDEEDSGLLSGLDRLFQQQQEAEVGVVTDLSEPLGSSSLSHVLFWLVLVVLFLVVMIVVLWWNCGEDVLSVLNTEVTVGASGRLQGRPKGARERRVGSILGVPGGMSGRKHGGVRAQRVMMTNKDSGGGVVDPNPDSDTGASFDSTHPPSPPPSQSSSSGERGGALAQKDSSATGKDAHKRVDLTLATPYKGHL